MNGFLTLISSAAAMLVLGLIMPLAAGVLYPDGPVNLAGDAFAGDKAPVANSTSSTEAKSEECDDASKEGRAETGVSPAPKAEKKPDGPSAADSLKFLGLPEGLKIEVAGDTCSGAPEAD